MNEVFKLNEGKILYYPTIEFIDDTYVSRALCLWDKIYRIVPAGFSPCDSDLVKHVVSEGIIENIVLSNNDLKDTSEEFMKFLESLDFTPDSLDDHRTTMLHTDKIEERLRPFMTSLAKKIEGRWLHISERLVNGYMLFLANSISRNRGISKMTDNENVYAAMSYFDSDGEINEYVYDGLKEDYYSLLTVPAVIPDGAIRLDIDTILKFREKTVMERSLFRSRVVKFANDLSDISDKEHSRELLLDFNRSLEESKESILDRSASFITGFSKSVFTVGVPTALSALGVLGANNPFDKVNLGKSITIGGVAALTDIKKSRKFRDETASYYFSMQNAMLDEYGYNIDYLPRFSSKINEFIND